jgi:hypothetical protein
MRGALLRSVLKDGPCDRIMIDLQIERRFLCLESAPLFQV